MDKWIDGWMVDGQVVDRWMKDGGWVDGYIMDGWVYWLKGRWIDIKINGQADGWVDKWVDGWVVSECLDGWIGAGRWRCR